MISETVYLHYLSALLDGNKKQCRQIVNKLIEEGESIKEIFINLFQRSMFRIGQLWEKQRCSVANEHIATKITESLIDTAVTKYSKNERVGKMAVIACIYKEHHELGARMIAGFFEANGWDTILLGSCTPQNEIIRLIKDKNPNVVGISSNFYLNLARLVRLIEAVEDAFPDLNIIVGGQTLAEGRSEFLSKYKNAKYIQNIDQLETYIKSV